MILRNSLYDFSRLLKGILVSLKHTICWLILGSCLMSPFFCCACLLNSMFSFVFPFLSVFVHCCMGLLLVGSRCNLRMLRMIHTLGNHWRSSL